MDVVIATFESAVSKPQNLFRKSQYTPNLVLIRARTSPNAPIRSTARHRNHVHVRESTLSIEEDRLTCYSILAI